MNSSDIDFKVLATATIVFLPNRELEEFNCESLLNKKHQKKEYNYNDQISLLNLSNNKLKKLKLYNLIYLKKLILHNNPELESIELVDCYNLDHLDISECASLTQIIGLDDCIIRVIECENTKIDFIEEKNNSTVMFVRDLEQIQHVIDNIYIGNSKHEEDELISLGITHIFNISKNKYREYKKIKETQIKIDDHINENILTILPNIVDNIKLLNDRGEKIYVHCFAGISRSATVVLYYIMLFHNYSFDSAFQFLRSKRVGIQPNLGFIKQLKSLEKKFVIVKN
jgi:protein-tyrosine phosphatase